MKRGVTDKSALALIRASFSQQALRDAANGTMKDGKVVSATQAKFDEKLDDMMCKAMWVDITKGMELSERVEYKQEARGRAYLLDPSNPEALNFADEQSVKTLNTATTGGLIYTTAISASLGDTTYIPTKEDDVDSQETDVFAQDAKENDKDGGDNKEIISNILDISKLTGKKAPQSFEDMVIDSDNNENGVQAREAAVKMIHSSWKVTPKATVSSGIPKGMSDEQRSSIRAMVDKWTAAHEDEQLPPRLAALAERAGLSPEKAAGTPTRMGKTDKVHINTPSAIDGAIPGSLKGSYFVMTGTWPELGGGHGLTSGRLHLKSCIEKFGSLVTSNYSCLTNFLVVGDNPGSKKVIKAHERKLKIIDINQLTKIMMGELMTNDLRAEDYPKAAKTVLEAKNIQVQRHPNSSSSETQAADGTDEDECLKPNDNTAGDGHSNG
jgi:hypothetical protein